MVPYDQMEGEEKGGVKAVSFAAGTAAFMACIERAVMVSVFVHWRLWAFLALNLLLLAILFTSKLQMPLNQNHAQDFATVKLVKKKSKQTLVDGDGDGGETKLPTLLSNNGDDDGKKEDYDQLTEEELNLRVEAFIAMFRQHLVSDAKGIKVT